MTSGQRSERSDRNAIQIQDQSKQFYSPETVLTHQRDTIDRGIQTSGGITDGALQKLRSHTDTDGPVDFSEQILTGTFGDVLEP